MCCPSSKGFEPAIPDLSNPTVVVVNNTPGVRRRGGEGGEEERSRGIPVVENNLVEEELDNVDREELEDTNIVEKQEEGGRHEEDFGEHLEFEYHEFPVFIGDYAISDEFP